TRCSKACRISWQQLFAACHFPQANREAANPVLWVRGANLRDELIAQAGGAWQEKWWPSRPKSILFLSVPERTRSPESRRNGTGRRYRKSSKIECDPALKTYAPGRAPRAGN